MPLPLGWAVIEIPLPLEYGGEMPLPLGYGAEEIPLPLPYEAEVTPLPLG